MQNLQIREMHLQFRLKDCKSSREAVKPDCLIGKYIESRVFLGGTYSGGLILRHPSLAHTHTQVSLLYTET